MGSGKVLLGVLAGVAVGATLGILFAPDKGSNTRRKISERSDEYVDGLEEKFNAFVEKMSKKFETMEQDGEKAIENGKAKLDNVVTEFVQKK